MIKCMSLFSKILSEMSLSFLCRYSDMQQRGIDYSILVKLIYVRNRSRRKDYLVLISTDITLSEEEIIRIYGKRWDIEVFFKVSKSYLKLTKECHLLSYDAMIAYVAIFFARNMMLAKKTGPDLTIRYSESSIVSYRTNCPISHGLSLSDFLLEVFMTAIFDKLSLTDKELEILLETFIEALPDLLKSKLLRCA